MNMKGDDSIIQELFELRAEVKEWLCEKCNTVFPGPPQPGFQCVVCPQCKGRTGPRLILESRRRITELYNALEALWNLPAPSHPGSCGPESGCDGICMDRANVNAMVLSILAKGTKL